MWPAIDDANPYAVRVHRRVRIGGILVRPGALITTPELKLALLLIGTGAGEAANRLTRLDAALGLALQRAIPRPAPSPLPRP